MNMRIVPDTNVFVAALLSPGGKNREVIRACLKGKATPLFGTALFHEYEALLGRNDLMRKSPLSAVERWSLFEALLSVAEWTKVYYLWRPNLPDEGDNHLIELAVAGGAEGIVTNNTADLKSGELLFPSVSIFTPSQFLEAISWRL
jgi:putative PIN family toxin of toxin-antitoxin system